MLCEQRLYPENRWTEEHSSACSDCGVHGIEELTGTSLCESCNLRNGELVGKSHEICGRDIVFSS